MAAATHSRLLCQYKGLTCSNPRAVGRNGKLLALCAFHRAKANRDQQRYVQRQRRQRQREVRARPVVASAPSQGQPRLPLAPIHDASEDRDLRRIAIVVWTLPRGFTAEAVVTPEVLRAVVSPGIRVLPRDDGAVRGSISSHGESGAHVEVAPIQPIPFAVDGGETEPLIEFAEELAYFLGE